MTGGLSRSQYAATVLVANTAGFLSVLGSLTICRTALRKRHKLYHRLLLSLSASDAASSTVMILHPWLMPADAPGLYWAVGTSDSCAIIGLCQIVALTLVSFYNAFLSTMFLLQIRYNWSHEKCAKQLERPAHVTAVCVSLFVGLSGLLSDSYAPRVYMNACWIGSCSTYDLHETGTCPESEIDFGWVMGWVSMLVLMINTGVAVMGAYLVYKSVRTQTQSNQTFRFEGTDNRHAQERQNQVMWQSIAYAMVYFNTFLWTFIVGVLLSFDEWLLHHEGEPGLYVIQVLTWTFVPSQGLLNFFVYTRPMYVQWRKAFPGKSRRWALYQAASSLESPPRNDLSRSRSMIVERTNEGSSRYVMGHKSGSTATFQTTSARSVTNRDLHACINIGEENAIEEETGV